MPSKIVLLNRHGESAANAGIATLSPDSIPLTDRGHQQAAQVSRAFPNSPDLIVTSPYLPARQTSEPTIKLFAFTKVEEWPVQKFTYLSLGELSETTATERRPLVKEYWDRCEVNY